MKKITRYLNSEFFGREQARNLFWSLPSIKDKTVLLKSCLCCEVTVLTLIQHFASAWTKGVTAKNFIWSKSTCSAYRQNGLGYRKLPKDGFRWDKQSAKLASRKITMRSSDTWKDAGCHFFQFVSLVSLVDSEILILWDGFYGLWSTGNACCSIALKLLSINHVALKNLLNEKKLLETLR